MKTPIAITLMLMGTLNAPIVATAEHPRSVTMRHKLLVGEPAIPSTEPSQQMRIFHLQHTRSDALLKTMRQLKLLGENLSAATPRTNLIVLRGDAASIEEASALIHLLEQPTPPAIAETGSSAPNSADNQRSMAAELQRFQGTWPMDICDSENATLHAPQKVVNTWKWSIRGHRIAWSRSGDEVWHLAFSIDPTKSPREIDLTYLDGPFKGVTCLGVYQWGGLNKDMLMLSLQDPGAAVERPKTITMTSGEQTSLIFLNPREPANSQDAQSRHQEELDSLQGPWSLEIIQTMSWPKPMGTGPDNFGQRSERQWVIRGNEITWISQTGREEKLTFTIDPTQSPKHFDVEFVSGPHTGKKCHGIYERGGVSGKMLWLCLVDPDSQAARPTKFGMSSESGHTLIGLELAKPEAGRTEPGAGEVPHFNSLPFGRNTNPDDSTLQQKKPTPVTRVATKPGSYHIKPGLKLVVTQGGTEERPTSKQSVVAELIWQTQDELKPSATYDIPVSNGLPYIIAWQEDGAVLWVNCGSKGSGANTTITRYLRILTIRGPGEVDESAAEIGTTDGDELEPQRTIPEEVRRAFEDAGTLKPLVLIGHTDWVKGIAFSPDGKWLASASRDRTIKLWDVVTGKETLTLKRSADLNDGHTGCVEDVQFTPDGKYLMSAGSSEQTIRIWNPVTGRNVHTLNAGGGVGASELAMSPDGTRLAVAGSTVRIFDMNLDVDRGWPVVELDAGNPFSVTFSPDGKRLASVGRDCALRVWDPITSEELLHVQHKHEFYCVKFSPDGKRLVTASMQGVNLWDAVTGKPTLTLQGAADHIHVVFSPDGRWLATAGWNKLVKLWDANTGEEVLTLAGHGNNVWALSFSPDGKLLATGSADRIVRVWDVTSLPEKSEARE